LAITGEETQRIAKERGFSSRAQAAKMALRHSAILLSNKTLTFSNIDQ